MTAGYDTIIGQEAHIISGQPSGPRAEFRAAETMVDDYSNLILLCSKDHAIVDQQVNVWTVERLLKIKRDHEEWVRDLPPEARPIKILPGEDYRTRPLHPIVTGEVLWSIVRDAHSFRFDRPQSGTEEELDYLVGAFETMKDWGELAASMDGLSWERNAEKDLGRLLDEAFSNGFMFTGRRVALVVTGGVLPDSTWAQAEIQTWRPDHLYEALRDEVERRSEAT